MTYSEECGVKGFWRRALYKLSGQKIISFFVSAGAVLLIVYMDHKWKAQLSDIVVLRAIGAIETICLALLGIKGTQNIVGMIKDGKTTKNNGD